MHRMAEERERGDFMAKSEKKTEATQREELAPNGEAIISLAGNPNVGKSTVFNALTGMHQHTGNWAGKTVTNAIGTAIYGEKSYILADLPGTYSLRGGCAEEEAARDFLQSGWSDAVIVVCDACCLERNLLLVLQVLEYCERVLVCVNLLDEAEKRGVSVDLSALEKQLQTPVVGITARSGRGLDEMMERLQMLLDTEILPRETSQNQDISDLVQKAEQITAQVISLGNIPADLTDRCLDRVLMGRKFGIPLMLLLLAGILWLTMIGANYPSALLSQFLFSIGESASGFLSEIGAPAWIDGLFIQGMYRTLAWVVSVMLPPMAIFFPLFTLLEDAGYLPRVAFNLDGCFRKCGACGKQALTMCMGFGCNAAGVTGCRIIDSPRERLIAILTNVFVPCNGRFPLLISLISMFFVTGISAVDSVLTAFLLLGVILSGIGMTFLTSKLLSKTLLRGVASSFTLELPPYRRPQIGKVIVRSIFDRTVFVLGRACIVAAPTGILIWLLANISVADQSLLMHCAGFLDPFAQWFGMDGTILLAFILGFPANEIVIPIILMSYLSQGSLTEIAELSTLRTLFVENGWTPVTALCVMAFSLLHFPCSTTVLTIYKETKSVKWTLFSVGLPTILGFAVCFVIHSVGMLFGF